MKAERVYCNVEIFTKMWEAFARKLAEEPEEEINTYYNHQGIPKENVVFILLYQVWKSREISIATKLKFFENTVNSFFCYGYET